MEFYSYLGERKIKINLSSPLDISIGFIELVKLAFIISQSLERFFTRDFNHGI